MQRFAMRVLALSLTIGMITSSAVANGNCTEDAMIVFDGSGSMAEMGFNDFDEPRIFEARRAIAAAIPEVAEFRRLGLLIYGPDGVDECSGLSVRFAPMENAAPAIQAAVDTLQPAGSTPLTEAVQMAADELQYRTRPAAIVVVTDGNETCGGMPCSLANQLASDGLDTTVHVIGFKVRSAFFSWGSGHSDGEEEVESVARCLSDLTGGTYTNTETVDQLIEALRATLGCKLLF